MLRIEKRTAPGSFLRSKALPVGILEHGKLFTKMTMKTINDRDGACGFAANQLRMEGHAFLALIDYKSWRFFANVKIIDCSDEVIIESEECLSLPGQEYEVERFAAIEISYEDERGNKRREHFGGSNARIIQHELDHLNGILISDKGSK